MSEAPWVFVAYPGYHLARRANLKGPFGGVQPEKSFVSRERSLKHVLRQNVPATLFNRKQSHRKCLGRLKDALKLESLFRS